MLAPWNKNYDQPRQLIKNQSHYFANKGASSQSYGFSSSHIWMWELDHKESWAPKNWCFWTVMLEKTLESPLDCKEIQPVSPRGNQSWLFTGRTDAEAETSILWPPDVKNWLVGKNPDAGKDWWQGERDDRGWDGWMASPSRWTRVWACCSPWGCKELDTTEWLNWLTDWKLYLIRFLSWTWKTAKNHNSDLTFCKIRL